MLKSLHFYFGAHVELANIPEMVSHFRPIEMPGNPQVNRQVAGELIKEKLNDSSLILSYMLRFFYLTYYSNKSACNAIVCICEILV